MSALVIEVPVDGDGAPQLNMPAGVRVERIAQGVIGVYADAGRAFVVLRRIGTRGTNPVFFAVTDRPGAKAFFEHLGANVITLAEARARPVVWAWLTDPARGLRFLRRAGVIVGIFPPVCAAGAAPRALGLDDQADGTDVAEDAPTPGQLARLVINGAGAS